MNKRPGDPGYEHGLVAKITCPGEAECPLRKLSESGSVECIERVEIIREHHPLPIHPYLLIGGAILLALVLLFSSYAHSDERYVTRSEHAELQIKDAEHDGEIKKLTEVIVAMSNRIGELEKSQADQNRELGRLEGTFGSLLAVMAFIQFIIQFSKRQQTTEIVSRKRKGEEVND